MIVKTRQLHVSSLAMRHNYSSFQLAGGDFFCSASCCRRWRHVVAICWKRGAVSIVSSCDC